uniref:C2H2-type domain-containing protein n=1 Tax=Panagrolaimus sp. ES5 TaxID=591445 RepID=A0AC34F8A8_9BILA
MTAMMEFMDVITIDDGSDDEDTQSSRNSSIVNGGTNYFASGATINITNERPLDLSQFLNFSTTAPKEITPPPQYAPPPRASSMTINAPFMSRASFLPRESPIKNVTKKTTNYINGLNGIRNGHFIVPNSSTKQPLNNTLPKILTDGNNRKRSLEPARQVQPSTTKSNDKRAKKDVHGSVNYIVSEPHQGFPAQDGEEFAGQFRCTSLNCNKVLSNNVSFMYHLWAHIAFFQRREFSTDYDQMTDEKFTRMCPVCLTVFETAFEKTRHYLEVHRGVFATYRLCHICESVDHDGKHVTEITHRPNELPYECRKCKFRSSSRMALIDHFSKVHIGTTMLMCPFCPFSTQISASERMKPVVLAKNYVQHVTEHGNIIAKKCSCCSYKFIDEERFEKHTKCHQNEQHRYSLQSKAFKTLKDESLKTKPRHEQLTLLKCVECSTQFPKAEDHFDELRKCDRCSFETTCIQSYWNHMHLSDCDPENEERFALAVTKDENFVRPKISFKIRKNLGVMKSKDYIQNFRMFRDFEYDRKPKPLPKSEEKTEIDLIKERREKLRNMTTARRTNDIPSYILDGIAESLFAEDKEDVETMEFIKGIRVPITSLVEEFLAEKKRKTEEEADEEMPEAGENSESAKTTTTPALLMEVDEPTTKKSTVEEEEQKEKKKVKNVEMEAAPNDV